MIFGKKLGFKDCFYGLILQLTAIKNLLIWAFPKGRALRYNLFFFYFRHFDKLNDRK